MPDTPSADHSAQLMKAAVKAAASVVPPMNDSLLTREIVKVTGELHPLSPQAATTARSKWLGALKAYPSTLGVVDAVVTRAAAQEQKLQHKVWPPSPQDAKSNHSNLGLLNVSAAAAIAGAQAATAPSNVDKVAVAGVRAGAKKVSHSPQAKHASRTLAPS